MKFNHFMARPLLALAQSIIFQAIKLTYYYYTSIYGVIYYKKNLKTLLRLSLALLAIITGTLLQSRRYNYAILHITKSNYVLLMKQKKFSAFAHAAWHLT